MARHIDPMEKITQRSVGFNLRQILFFAKHPDFKPDQFCRTAVDKQIAEIDPFYLSDDDERRTQ